MAKRASLNRSNPMASRNEPVLARVDRLDHLIGNLEDIKGIRSGKSSSVSTPRSGTTSSGGNYSESSPSSPASLESRCRPLNEVLVETQLKGTIIHRVEVLENRVIKLEELMAGNEEEGSGRKIGEGREEKEEEKKARKKHRGTLKRLVKSCVKKKPKGEEK